MTSTAANGAATDPLAEGRSRLAFDAPGALAAARRAVTAAPGSAEARLLLGAALRRSGAPQDALTMLRPLAESHPDAWGVAFELGAALALRGESATAMAALERARALNPKSILARAALTDQARILTEGRWGGEGPEFPPSLLGLAQALFEGRPDAAQQLAGAGLQLSDPIAVKLIADLALEMGRYEDAERLAAESLARAPDFAPLRLAYAVALYRQRKLSEARVEAEHLATRWPCRWFQSFRAAVATETGDYETALALSAQLVDQDPTDAEAWLVHGHLLKTVGRQADSVAAYRRSLDLQPNRGAAYWSLANLKVIAFTDEDLSRMEALAARAYLSAEDRAPLHFALGKALDDAGRHAESFRHYEAGARLRASERPFDADAHSAFIQRSIATFTPRFLATRSAMGAPARDPIFIVGLPRSGSTLVEQILAAHSAVEGLSELPEMTAVAAAAAGDPADYPSTLTALSAEALRELGDAYLARAALYRKLERPHFVDKFPGNVLHVGLIHLILPHARIIDVRRNALDCCLSCFTQDFAEGQAYSYDLGALGRYYRDYLILMDHFDQVLPGRIHRLEYEALLADPEAEVRRLLAYCGLTYEPGCLKFHESRRPVRTASSEQVRRPLNAAGVGRWRRFEPWLGPLKAALGGSPASGA